MSAYVRKHFFSRATSHGRFVETCCISISLNILLLKVGEITHHLSFVRFVINVTLTLQCACLWCSTYFNVCSIPWKFQPKCVLIFHDHLLFNESANLSRYCISLLLVWKTNDVGGSRDASRDSLVNQFQLITTLLIKFKAPSALTCFTVSISNSFHRTLTIDKGTGWDTCPQMHPAT